jgi:hypothetical protein
MKAIRKHWMKAMLSVWLVVVGAVCFAQAPFDNEDSQPETSAEFSDLPLLGMQSEDLEAWMPPTSNSKSEFGFDNGFFLKVQDEDKSFEFKANMRAQFRYVTFTRANDTWTNNAGVTVPIVDRRYFDVERARLVFSGHAFTRQLPYFLQYDSDTDSRDVAAMLDGWIGWDLSDASRARFGKRKVPGTRNWMLGAFDTRMVDRPMANEFFRPSRTTGVWLLRNPNPQTYYELMIGQGYNTEGLVPSEMGENFAVGGSIYRDILGDYGPLRPTDFEWHDELAVRLGLSAVRSVEGTPGRQLQEADFLRLTDGTRITEIGALAPGATIESFNVLLLAFDAAYKYRGWSANSEFFLRSITDLVADMPVAPVGLQYGFYCEGGCFLIPRRFELNSQYSFVTGEQGSSNSYALGTSIYPKRSQYLKLSLDGTYIDGNPTNSTGADMLVGEKGFLFRTQLQAQF